MTDWQGFDEVHWLVPDTWNLSSARVSPFARAGMPFRQLLLSCDAILTKPGYGTFVEAVCNGVPLLSIERPDWPESAVLTRWARDHGRIVELPRADLEQGRFQGALAALWRQAGPPPPAATGAADAVAVLAALAGLV